MYNFNASKQQPKRLVMMKKQFAAAVAAALLVSACAGTPKPPSCDGGDLRPINKQPAPITNNASKKEGA